MPVPLLAGNDNTNYKNVLLDLIASKGNMNELSPMMPLVMNQNQALDRVNHVNAALLSHEESIKVESEVSDFIGSPLDHQMHTLGKIDDMMG
jgi:hypothetical protein